MGWKDININLLQGSEFSINAEELVLRVFDRANEALDDEWKRYMEGFDKHMSEPMEESEADIAFSEMHWEQDLHRQRMQGVGALALDWLMCSLQGALHSAKKYLNSTHPAKGPYYKKQGWLGEVADEYKHRFGIDFTTGPVRFEHIQELVLARNAGIHRDRAMLDEYLKKTGEPTFVDKDSQFCVTRTALVTIIKECQEFIRWIVSEIEKLGPKAASSSTSASVV
jgi:hypothetical protein